MFERVVETISNSRVCCSDSSDTSSDEPLMTSRSESDVSDEISRAIREAEESARREARARFKTSDELVHRLFVCVSGVADQLQTNYASDLRHVLQCVFECNASPDDDDASEEDAHDKSASIIERAPLVEQAASDVTSSAHAAVEEEALASPAEEAMQGASSIMQF